MRRQSLLSIDLGTTHCKAGLFDLDGRALKIVTRPMDFARHREGFTYHKSLWNLVVLTVRELLAGQTAEVKAAGITGMGEGGQLISPESWFIPWFDTTCQPQADEIAARITPQEGYEKYGLRISYKCALARILWWKQTIPFDSSKTAWLDGPGVIAWRMTGETATERSLACRTYAYRLEQETWDTEWLESLGIPASIFPPVRKSGEVVGHLSKSAADELGLAESIPVSICGHDHICAAFGAGAVEPGSIFNSMGTAETLVGALTLRPLSSSDFESGLNYGLHTAEGRAYWLGGLSASGGSLEWARSLLGSPPLEYREIEKLLSQTPPGPSGIIYLPYLLGSGSPHTDPKARGAWIGLTRPHTRAQLVKSVLEGTAFEVELIRRAGEKLLEAPVQTILAAGGSTRSPGWMQIKADVLGLPISVVNEPEAALLGAALLAGVGAGVFHSQAEALQAAGTRAIQTYSPSPSSHDDYRQLYEDVYQRVIEPLRAFDHRRAQMQPVREEAQH